MTISAATFLEYFPDFSTESNDRINLFLTESARYVNTNVWGAKANFAQALYTAHLISTGNSGASSGSLSSDKVGDLSQNYSTQTSDTSLGATSYGLQFLQLRKSLLLSPMVIRRRAIGI